MAPRTLQSCTCHPPHGGAEPSEECRLLVQQALAGDREAQAALLKKFENLAKFMVGRKYHGRLQHADFEDQCQAIYTDWLALLDTWDPDRWDFCYWCALKAGNRLLMDQRKSSLRPELTELKSDPPAPPADKSAIDPVLADCLQAAIRRFPPDWQRALDLYLAGEQNRGEIADTLGISRRSLYSWLQAMFERLASQCL